MTNSRRVPVRPRATAARRCSVPRNLPTALRAELEWALELLASKGDPSPDQSSTIRAAIRAQSPILHKRFAQLVDNRAARARDPEERSRLGALILALEANAEGKPWRLYQPGEFDGAR